jgi:PAS domain S-box-containing protein
MTLDRGIVVGPMSLYDLLLNTPPAIIGANGLDEIIYVTSSIENVLGWTSDELMGKPTSTIVPERFREAHTRGFQQFIKTGKLTLAGRPLRTTSLTKSGREIPVEITLGTYKTDDGDVRVISMIRDIKDYVELEEEGEKLRHQLNYARSITAYLGEGLIVIDANGEVKVVNIMAEKILGFKESDIIGKLGHDAIHCWYPDGQYKKSSSCPILMTLQDGEVRQSEDDYFIKKDGSFVNVSIISSPIKRNGHIVGTVITFTELTEKKLQTKRLQESEERYRSLVELSPDPICIYQNGSFVFMNSAGLKLLGASSLDQIVGRSVLDFIHPDYHERVIERMTEVVQGNKSTPPLQEKALRLDGRPIDIEVMSTPIVYNDLLSVLVVVRDISERIRFEEEIRGTVEAMPVLVATASPDGKAEYYNKNWYDYTGLTYERLKDNGWQEVIDPDYRAALAERRSESFKTGTPFSMATKLRSKTGEYRWFIIQWQPIVDSTGKVLRWVSAATDIDEQKRSQEFKSRLAAIVDSSNDPIISKTLDGIIISWNKAAERVYGYKSEEVIGKSVIVIIPEDKQVEYDGIMSRVRRGSTISQLRTERVTKDNRRIQVVIDVFPVRDDVGETIGASTIAKVVENG